MCVEKLRANETREQCYDLRQKQVIRAMGLSKQCTDTYKDSHDAARHKLRRTLACSFQQFYLPFHLQFVTLDHPLCMFGESVFALIPDHEMRATKLMNRWISGSWWGRDASSDEHLVGTKWNFDVEMDSGIPGPTLEPRRDEGMPTAAAPMEIPTVPPPAPPPEKHVFEMRVHSNSGRGDVAAKMRMVICDPSYMNLGKTKVIGKVVHTNTHETPIPELLNEDGKSINTGQIITTQKSQVCNKGDINAAMVLWRKCVDSQGPFAFVTPSLDLDTDALRSASCSPKHTENTPITSIWKVCLSVSRQCLSRPIEQGNPWERATSIRLVLVSETRTVPQQVF